MLEVRNLTIAYGSDQVLGGVDLDLPVGDSLVLVGESGTGKTTLGLAIMGLCEGMVNGSILFKGKDLLRLDGAALREIQGNQIAMVFQNVNQVLDPVYRVIDQVIEPILAHGPQNRGEAPCDGNPRRGRSYARSVSPLSPSVEWRRTAKGTPRHGTGQ